MKRDVNDYMDLACIRKAAGSTSKPETPSLVSHAGACQIQTMRKEGV